MIAAKKNGVTEVTPPAWIFWNFVSGGGFETDGLLFLDQMLQGPGNAVLVGEDDVDGLDAHAQGLKIGGRGSVIEFLDHRIELGAVVGGATLDEIGIQSNLPGKFWGHHPPRLVRSSLSVIGYRDKISEEFLAKKRTAKTPRTPRQTQRRKIKICEICAICGSPPSVLLCPALLLVLRAVAFAEAGQTQAQQDRAEDDIGDGARGMGLKFVGFPEKNGGEDDEGKSQPRKPVSYRKFHGGGYHVRWAYE
jgi:hypothetical protein